MGEVVDIRGQCRKEAEGTEEIFVRAEGILVGLEVADAPFVDKLHAMVVEVVHIFGEPDGLYFRWLVLVELTCFHIDIHFFFRCHLEVGFGIRRAGKMIVKVAAFGHGGEELAQGCTVVFDVLEVFRCVLFLNRGFVFVFSYFHTCFFLESL